MNAEVVRVVVQFTVQEVELLDQATDRLNLKPGARATRSDVVRIGALQHATAVLEAAQKAAAGEDE